MALTVNTTLLLLDQPLTEAQCAALSDQTSNTDEVIAICLNELASQGAFDEEWQVRTAGEFFDGDQLRDEFLTFLNTWPAAPLRRGKCFDDLFANADGRSLWWTGPGIGRHPDKGVFLTLRSVWLVGRAIDACSPARLVLALADNQAARAVHSLARHQGIEATNAPWCRPATTPFAERVRWLFRALVWLVLVPWELLLRAIIARCQAGRGAGNETGDTVVLTCAYPRHARFSDGGEMQLTFWRDLELQLTSGDDALTVRHLLHTVPGQMAGHRSVGRYCHTAWPALKERSDILPLQETIWPIGAYLRSLPRQIAALFRYFRLEGRQEFRDSFRFAGADVSGLYVPLLRRAVARIAGWGMTVSAIARCLRRAGNVKAVLVCEEMYPMGMMDIAAAHRLGVPAIGVQHGTLFPMHLIYTVPPGQVAGSPIPDRFAVFGDYDREVLSQVGSFPADRIAVTGSQRLDHLVSNPPDPRAAREQLGLPTDKKILLLATQFYPWFLQAGKAVFTAVAGRDDCIVCVKTHPRDVPLDVYRQLAVDVGATNVRFYDSYFDELLAACDVLISGSSTTMFEAILLGRDAICVNFSDEPDRYPYVADGGALSARTPEQVGDAVAQSLAGDAALAQGRARFVAHHAGRTATGQGSEAIATLVKTCAHAVKEGA
jgi:surface carbohydrate biosynthesis protein (TIGR04326 family)